MGTRGAVTLGDIEGRLDLLEVACSKCARSGRYRISRLIAAHGRDMGLPDLKHVIAGDCPKIGNYVGRVYDCCGAYFGNLS